MSTAASQCPLRVCVVQTAYVGLHREAYCTTGYTPFLSFSVQDLQQTVNNMLQLGASLDGSIHYPGNGKLAAIKAPDGQMISLHETETSA